MNVLIFDKVGRYKSILEFLAEQDDYQIDYITHREDISLKNVNVVIGERMPKVLKLLKAEYDLIVDTDGCSVRDIDFIFQNIEVKKYIYFSTFQVYGLLSDNIIHAEDSVDQEYFDMLDYTMLDLINNRRHSYILERLNCERQIHSYLRKDSQFVVLRLSKLYAEDDYYKDISWISNRISLLRGIVLKESDVMRAARTSCIYMADLVNVIKKLLSNFPLNFSVYNISQNEQISFGDIVSVIAKIRNESYKYYIFSDSDIEQKLGDYNIPNGNTLVLSNEKWNKQFQMSYTPTEEWIARILQNKQQDEEERKAKINEMEYQMVKKQMLMQRHLNKFQVV